jgi:uncharacterized protein YfaS (alpha-2-macroglobulin family)
MALKDRLVSIFGQLKWTPPPWAQRLGGRRFATLLVAVLLAGGLAYAAYIYYESLPRPPRVVAEVQAPGVTPIVDDKLVPQPVTIRFSYQPDPDAPMPGALSAARIDLVGMALKGGIALDPAMPGEWKWAEENLLTFAPAEDWPAGQAYTVRFEPLLFSAEIELASDRVEFSTPELAVELEALEFYQDPVERSLRKVVGTLAFSHPVDPDSLNENLALLMRETDATVSTEPQSVGYRVDYDKFGRKAFVHSDPITLPERENFLSLHLEKGVRAAAGPSRLANLTRGQVGIPDVSSYFRVESLSATIARNDDDEPVQTVVIGFTDRVATEGFSDRVGAYLLPVDRRTGNRTQRRYRWQTPREVTADILAQSEQLELLPNPTDGDAAQLQSFRFDAPESRHIYVRVEGGLKSEGGFVMNSAYDEVLAVPPYPKEAKVARQGALLPLTGTQRLTFLARGVNTLKVEVGRLLADQISHLASQTGGDISNPYFNNYNFGQDNIAELSTRFIDLNPAHPREAVYATLDLSEYLPDGGFYFVQVQGWDRQRERVIGQSDQRFVLITDLGLLVKTGADQSQDVFVHSIASGRPVAGARVQLLGKNGLAVLTQQTDSRGHASLAPANDFERDKTPTAFLVEYRSDTVFMPYARPDRQLQYSRFDIGGERVSRRDEDQRLKADLFTDRGLYRPGDHANIAAIVKRDDWVAIGAIPLEFFVTDPRGQTVLRQRIQLPDDGFLEWRFDTEAVSPTGNYTANLYLIDENNRRKRSLGSTGFKVEEFQPDRMRIRTEVVGQKPRGWLKPGQLSGRVTLENLFGTPAEDRRVTGELRLQPTTIRFSEHEGFTFGDPFRERDTAVRPVSLKLPESRTGPDGIAELPLDVSQYDQGIYRLLLFTEGFEAGGGRSVKAQASVILSPLDHLVGHKADGDLGFVTRGSERQVQFLAVDADAQSVPLDEVSLQIVEQRYVSTLVQKPNGTYAYQSVLKEIPLSEAPFRIAKDGSSYTLPTDQPGQFMVKIVTADELMLSKVEFIVAGARNLAGNLERNAELDLKLKGEDFVPGTEIEMEITAPYTGMGLITIERDSVYAFKWFRSDTNTSVQRIQVPQDLEGNAYLNVAFIRDLNSPEIFVSPLSYAVAPFAVDRSARTLNIDLAVPERVRPGEELAIGYRSSRPSRLVVFAVDEGILQVAKYQTPDPLGFFLRKKALQVATHQMVDLILPDYDLIRQAAAAGGGEGADLLGRNLNPFRRKTDAPVVYWSGIVDADAEQREARYRVPDYFTGKLRVMAVAVSADALGAQEAATIVRGPFVITPNVLTVAAPGDEFDVSVGLSNNLEGSGENAEVQLSVTPSEQLELVGDSTAALQVPEGREGRAGFRVRARNRLGAAKLTFEARLGDDSTRLGATLSVRPAVPIMTTVASGFTSEDPVDLELARELYDEFAEQRAAASSSPLVLADGLLDFLSTFPHACAEQIVSKVFPQIGFLQGGDYAVDEQAIRKIFDRTIFTLRSRQHADGGFLFWASSTEAARFPSVYIMHFLTDARELGLSVPQDMRNAGLGYLRNIAAEQADSLQSARTRAYAIYVLTRNGTVTTNYLTNLHEYLDREHEKDWRADLTASYMAASYAILKNATLARGLIGEYQLGSGPEMASDFDTRLGRDAQYVYLVARHFAERLPRIEPGTIRELVEPVFQNRFNTLSSAYTILALGEYSRGLLTGAAGADTTISAVAADDTLSLLSGAADAFARAAVPNEVGRVRISGGAEPGVYHVLTQTGFDAELPERATSEGMEIFREYLDDDDKPVSSATVGDELTARLRVRSLGGYRTNAAVIDLLPAGFEVLPESIRNRYDDWNLEYKDVREDRVVVYGSFHNRLTEIRYRVKATSPGAFVVPSAYAGSMYDRTVHARSEPTRFTVARPE